MTTKNGRERTRHDKTVADARRTRERGFWRLALRFGLPVAAAGMGSGLVASAMTHGHPPSVLAFSISLAILPFLALGATAGLWFTQGKVARWDDELP